MFNDTQLTTTTTNVTMVVSNDYPVVKHGFEELDAGRSRILYEELIKPTHLPVKPLIDIVIQYAQPFRSLCTTFIGPAPGDLVLSRRSLDPPIRSAHIKSIPSIIVMQLNFNQQKPVDAIDEKMTKKDVNENVNENNGKETKRAPLVVFLDDDLIRADRIRQISNGYLVEIKETRGATGFDNLMSLVIDPRRPNRVYVGTTSSVQRMDLAADGTWLTSCLAGHDEDVSMQDGSRLTARFNSIVAMLCTYDGKELLVCDKRNHCIRSICIDDEINESTYGRTKTVENITLRTEHAFLGRPISLCYLRSDEKSPIVIGRSNEGIFTMYQPGPSWNDLKILIFDSPYKHCTVYSRLGDNVLVGTNKSTVVAVRISNEGKLISVTTLAGNPKGKGYENGSLLNRALFTTPTYVYVDETTSPASLLVHDTYNDRAVIRRITLSHTDTIF